jgi:hypothetical protein
MRSGVSFMDVHHYEYGTSIIYGILPYILPYEVAMKMATQFDKIYIAPMWQIKTYSPMKVNIYTIFFSYIKHKFNANKFYNITRKRGLFLPVQEKWKCSTVIS